MRDWLNGSTANTGNHWVEIEVYGASRTKIMVSPEFEWDTTSGVMTKYYFADGQAVAMRVGNGSGTNGLQWLLTDHLGSTSITANGSSGAKLSELRYKPWGELRYAWSATATDRRYTGQRQEGIGLFDYNARFYDVALGRFISADTLIPEPYDSQSWDRYAVMANNPVRFTDPTGHCIGPASILLPVCVIIAFAIIGEVANSINEANQNSTAHPYTPESTPMLTPTPAGSPTNLPTLSPTQTPRPITPEDILQNAEEVYDFAFGPQPFIDPSIQQALPFPFSENPVWPIINIVGVTGYAIKEEIKRNPLQPGPTPTQGLTPTPSATVTNTASPTTTGTPTPYLLTPTATPRHTNTPR